MESIEITQICEIQQHSEDEIQFCFICPKKNKINHCKQCFVHRMTFNTNKIFQFIQRKKTENTKSNK